MNIYLKLLTPFFIFIFLGCTPTQEPDLGKKYNQEQLQERAVLNKSYKSIRQMENIDAALYLNKTDLTSLMNETFGEFSQHFVSLDAPGFSHASFGRMQVFLKQGQIRSQINFSFEVDALGREIFGHLMAEHTLKAGTDKFIINTKFDEIILDRIDETQPLKDNSKNKDLIATSVKNFLHTLNIEIINMPLTIDVDMNILSGVNGKDIFRSPDYKLHSAAAVNMQTKMDSYVSYISKKGVVLLGSSTLIDGFSYEEVSDLKILRSSIRGYIDTTLKRDMGIDLESLQKYSSYYIRKGYVSSQMNKALYKMDLRVINKFFLKIAQEDKELKKDIYFFDKDRLPSCRGVEVNCSQLLKPCKRQCGVKFGIQNCVQCDDMTNPFEQVRCLSKLEACKSKEELHLYECHKREDRCSVDNTEIKTACAVDNLERVASCKEDKEKLNFINDEIVLAQLNINFDIANSYAVQNIRRIVFDSELKQLEVVRNMHISVDSKLKAGLKNNVKNDINCSLAIKEDLLTHSQVDHVEKTRKLSLLTQRAKNGNMMIKAISKPTFINAQLNNHPYDRLMKNKKFIMQCSYKNMPMKPIPAKELLKSKEIPYALNSLLGGIEIAFEEEEFSFLILPVKLNEKILFYPTMEKEAIGFSRQAHFY